MSGVKISQLPLVPDLQPSDSFPLVRLGVTSRTFGSSLINTLSSTTQGLNVGGGTNIFKQKNGPTLQFKTLSATGGIQITADDNVVTLSTQQLLTLIQSAASPVGSVITVATNTAPAGWLKCNGVVVPNGTGTVQGITADFSALYNTLGSTYGTPGQLPDLRGEFVRGWDDSRGIDSGRTLGSFQADDFKSHTHSLNYTTPLRANDVDRGDTGRFSLFSMDNEVQPSTNASGGTETRPRNVALLYCIKY